MYLRYGERQRMEDGRPRGHVRRRRGHQDRDAALRGGVRVRAHEVRARRPPARADLAVRRRGPAAHVLRVGPRLARDRRHDRGRDQRQGPADRHVPGRREGRPARQQDGVGDPDHAPAVGDRRPVPERAVAAQEPGLRDEGPPRRASTRRRRRGAAGEGRRPRGHEDGDRLRLADPLVRPRALPPRQGPPDDFEMGDVDRVLDGDLDGYVEAYLQTLRQEGREGRGRPAGVRRDRTGVTTEA